MILFKKEERERRKREYEEREKRRRENAERLKRQQEEKERRQKEWEEKERERRRQQEEDEEEDDKSEDGGDFGVNSASVSRWGVFKVLMAGIVCGGGIAAMRAFPFLAFSLLAPLC